MTGDEHFKEAQRLLTVPQREYETEADLANQIARAQVHATLALASAVDEGYLYVQARRLESR